MKRFYHKQSIGWLTPLAAVLIFGIIMMVFLFGISKLSRQTAEQQIETLERAISRSIAHCYATEGHYPESLEYLKDEYGITYDSEKFFVDYQAIGGNIFPEVTIISR